MFTKVYSLGVHSLEGFLVTVEVDISGGLPQFTIVGLPDTAVKEATDRVRSALKNLGFTYPVSRITVNLAPASTKKVGSVYDLPVLLGLLVASKQLEPLNKEQAFIGELSLDGAIRPVNSVLPMAMACKANGIKCLFVPKENALEAALIEDLEIYAVSHTKELINHLQKVKLLQKMPPTAIKDKTSAQNILNFADVSGQLEAKRAMEIVACGLHNILFIGAPGVGKSMLAKRLPSILPPMTEEQVLETGKIYSVAGFFNTQQMVQASVDKQPPFRSPHYLVSAVGLTGGGANLKPGEMSLANNGVLFLDELPEFKREALESLRQPMEEGYVTISRAAGTVSYPSKFILVAAMNPCPCGYYGSTTHTCSCSVSAIERYKKRISGPLLDRIDLQVYVQPVAFEDMHAQHKGESSEVILKRVLKVQDFQKERMQNQFISNAYLDGEQLKEQCVLSTKATVLLKQAFEQLALSARGHDRILRISRTIADMDFSPTIKDTHILEAIQYRGFDRKTY